jgi:energy-coupling factor transporter ATP-binding protein EcfA2
MAKRITKLKLTEISSVDNPAQPHATMSIMKRHDPLTETIQKYYGEIVREREPIKNFDELLNLRDKESKLWKAREELWPVMDAFRETVNNIVVDVNLSLEAKMAQIESNVNSFVAAVRDKVPDVEEELTKFFKDAGLSGINSTDNTEKTPVSEENVTKMAELEASVAELTKKLEEAEAVAKMTDAEKEYVSALSDKEKIAWTNMDADERSKRLKSVKKNDETVEVSGQVIAKSAVGDATFAIFKAQAEQIKKAEERIAKAEEAAEFADLRKRADDEFGNVVGSTDERANLLKALKAVGGEVEAYGLKVLKSANEAAVFTNIGKADGKAVDVTKALDAKIAEIQKRDNISRTAAMEKVAVEAPELIENKE